MRKGVELKNGLLHKDRKLGEMRGADGREGVDSVSFS